MLNPSTIRSILWWNSDMDTSDSLDIVVGGNGVVSFYAERFVAVLENLPICVDVVGAYGVYDVFDGGLEGLITATEGF